MPSLANAAARAADAPGVSADNSDDGLCVLACGRKIVVARSLASSDASRPFASFAWPCYLILAPHICLMVTSSQNVYLPRLLVIAYISFLFLPQVAPMPLEKQAQRLLKAGLLDEALAVAEEAASCSPGGEFSQARPH